MSKELYEYNEKTERLGNKHLKVYPAFDGNGDAICFGNSDFTMCLVHRNALEFYPTQFKFPTNAEYYRAIWDIFSYWYGSYVGRTLELQIERKDYLHYVLRKLPLLNGMSHYFFVDEHNDSSGGQILDHLMGISLEDFKTALELYSPLIDDNKSTCETFITVSPDEDEE